MLIFVVGISNNYMLTGIKALLCFNPKLFSPGAGFSGAKFAVQGQKPLVLALNAGWDVVRLVLASVRGF